MAMILNEEQESIKSLVREFMEKIVKPEMAKYDESGEFPEEIHKSAFEMGLHCLQIPEEYGGAGLSHMCMAVALEEMGRVDPGFAITMLSTSLTLKDVLVGGNDAQKGGGYPHTGCPWDVQHDGAKLGFGRGEPDDVGGEGRGRLHPQWGEVLRNQRWLRQAVCDYSDG